MILKGGLLLNALVQMQARYHHCGEGASEKCLAAATFVRWRGQNSRNAARSQDQPLRGSGVGTPGFMSMLW
jgi:hypothetical protein